MTYILQMHTNRRRASIEQNISTTNTNLSPREYLDDIAVANQTNSHLIAQIVGHIGHIAVIWIVAHSKHLNLFPVFLHLIRPSAATAEAPTLYYSSSLAPSAVSASHYYAHSPSLVAVQHASVPPSAAHYNSLPDRYNTFDEYTSSVLSALAASSPAQLASDNSAASAAAAAVAVVAALAERVQQTLHNLQTAAAAAAAVAVVAALAERVQQTLHNLQTAADIVDRDRDSSEVVANCPATPPPPVAAEAVVAIVCVETVAVLPTRVAVAAAPNYPTEAPVQRNK
eukprot:CAMPEP_0197079448 /NCGR_PEP_ID=MMETSP1384-20130603/213631_1 /TAXON_ID=29189 /ORGANISM="Ammonia sp." /LENGTH=283 /DNA_ID=CAMNT_0042518325 /DNA_START=229 /DNA_END=1079 /DNA_ORIENTATION=+